MLISLKAQGVARNSVELSLIKLLEFSNSNPKPPTFDSTQLYSLCALVGVKLESGTLNHRPTRLPCRRIT